LINAVLVYHGTDIYLRIVVLQFMNHIRFAWCLSDLLCPYVFAVHARYSDLVSGTLLFVTYLFVSFEFMSFYLIFCFKTPTVCQWAGLARPSDQPMRSTSFTAPPHAYAGVVPHQPPRAECGRRWL
jgi:hypothetical protein